MRILWLDNDVNYLTPYVAALKSEGLDVTVVSTVSEAAFRLDDSTGGRYDLLILDVMIPTKTASEETTYPPNETDHGYRTGLVFYRRRKKALAVAGTKVLILTVLLVDEVYNDFIAEGLPPECYATKYALRNASAFVHRVKLLLSVHGTTREVPAPEDSMPSRPPPRQTHETGRVTKKDPSSRGLLAKERRLRVFVGSTSSDLRRERQVLQRALAGMSGVEFVGMENFGSRPDSPREVCLREVAGSDVYVGLLGHHYGSLDPESGHSMTELEYREARRRGLPYFKEDGISGSPGVGKPEPSPDAKLRDLKDEIRRDLTVDFFRGPNDLAAKVVAALYNL